MKKLISLILMLTLLCGCAFAENTAEDSVITPDYDHLTVGVITKISGDFFTDMWGNGTTDADVRALLHGYGMIKWQNESATFTTDPSVVTGLSAADDAKGNRTYTIVLADDLVYSDGTPITAYDYAFSILLSVAPEMAQIGANTSASDYIFGIDEYLAGTQTALAGVRVISKYILAITVKAQYEPFFYEVSYLNYSPYPISVIAPGCEVADDGKGVYIRNIDSTIEEPIFNSELLRETILNVETGYRSHPSVVSGPYTLTAYDDSAYTADFELNPYFKGNENGEKPVIQTLSIVPVSNEDMYDKLAGGEIGLINKIVMADAIDTGIQMAGEKEYSIANYPRSGLSFISFNCERPAVSSAAVRKAIYMCLEKEDYIKAAVRNYGIGVDAYYGMGQWIYQLVSGTIAPPVEEPAEGATEEEQAAYDAQIAEWEALSMEDIQRYSPDVEGAIALLESDGWILNAEGKKYDPEKDSIRCKLNDDGEMVSLDLKLIIADTSTLAETIDTCLTQNLIKAGIALTIEYASSVEMLEQYYRIAERDCDMFLLATNFSLVFDPSFTYMYTVDDEGNITYGDRNYCMIADEKLLETAEDMRRTAPGDLLTYCRKWIEFEKRWVEVLPAIPLYSNVYFDSYSSVLHNYEPSAGVNWGQALFKAYLGEVTEIVEEEETEETTDESGDVTIA